MSLLPGIHSRENRPRMHQRSSLGGHARARLIQGRLDNVGTLGNSGSKHGSDEQSTHVMALLMNDERMDVGHVGQQSTAVDRIC